MIRIRKWLLLLKLKLKPCVGGWFEHGGCWREGLQPKVQNNKSVFRWCFISRVLKWPKGIWSLSIEPPSNCFSYSHVNWSRIELKVLEAKLRQQRRKLSSERMPKRSFNRACDTFICWNIINIHLYCEALLYKNFRLRACPKGASAERKRVVHLYGEIS